MSAVLGHGLYDVPAASRLTGVPRRRVRDWTHGYQTKGRCYGPLWRPRYDDDLVLGFLDLQQLRLVHILRSRGVSLQAIRRALHRARTTWALDYPFASQRIRTLGRTIFLEITQEEEEPLLVELLKNQQAWHAILDPYLQDVTFGDDGLVAKWNPGRGLHDVRDLVMVSPEYRFGRPVTSIAGVETQVLAAHALSGAGVEATASWYGASGAEVRAAVRFEQFLDDRSAA